MEREKEEATRIKNQWRTTRNSLLAVIVIIVTIVFTLPIVFFFIFEYTDFTQHSVQSVNHSIINESIINNTLCDSEITWSEDQLSTNDTTTTSAATEVCKSYEYTAKGICDLILLKWSYCITSSVNATFVGTSVSYKLQNTLNKNLQDINQLLSNFRECQIEALPFLCQYYFPLVDCYNNKIYSASQEECNRISTTACAIPWRLALSTQFADKLPVCDSLGYSNKTMNDTAYDFDDFSNSNISCRDDFFLLNNTSCVPRCDKFRISQRAHLLFEYSCEIIAGISGIVAFVMVSLYTIKERKRVIRFPTIFTIFLLADCGLAGFTILLSAFVGSKPFCSSLNLIETLENEPTGICIFSGVIFHYTFVSMTVWWFIHLSVLVFRVAFPFTAQRMSNNKKFKYLYWILLVIGFLYPVPPVVISLTTKENRYRVYSLPPHVCRPPNAMWFYSQLLPINILLGIGVCLLSYIIWILNKMRIGALPTQKRFTIGPGERKLIIVFMVYLVFGVYTMAQTTILIGYQDRLSSEIANYFQCEALGYVPEKCSRSGFEAYRFPYLIGIVYLLLSLTPFSVLSFVINWQECLKVCIKTKIFATMKGSKLISKTSASTSL